jgi:hypothetical protein
LEYNWRIKMIGMLRLGAAIIVSCLVLSSHATALCVAPTRLTGAWTANDGGTYLVRLLGNTVWWVGRSADDGASWTNTFKGMRDGNIITGEWADVIRHGGSGTLTLRINGELGIGVHGFEKIGSTGAGFGGEHWFMPCNDTP